MCGRNVGPARGLAYFQPRAKMLDRAAKRACGRLRDIMAAHDRIAVIGAGIGGLATALALLRRGLDVEVYEQAPQLGEVGAGIQISSNGTRVLYALGLEEALRRVQVLPSRRHIRHWSTGETWDWFELGANAVTRFGAPYVLMHRGDLHGILADAVRALKEDAVVLDRRCVALSQTDDHAEVRFAGGEVVRSDLVIGAD